MTTGMQVMVLRAANNSDLSAGIETGLVNVSDGQPAMVQAGAIMRDIYIKRRSTTITDGVNIKIGVASASHPGADEWFVPSTAFSTQDLQIDDTIGYEPQGVRKMLPNDAIMTVTADADCEGSLEFYLEYMIYDYLS